MRSLAVTMPSRRSPRVTSTASAPFAIRWAASDRRPVIGMASTGRAISPTTCDHPGVNAPPCAMQRTRSISASMPRHFWPSMTSRWRSPVRAIRRRAVATSASGVIPNRCVLMTSVTGGSSESGDVAAARSRFIVTSVWHRDRRSPVNVQRPPLSACSVEACGPCSPGPEQHAGPSRPFRPDDGAIDGSRRWGRTARKPGSSAAAAADRELPAWQLTQLQEHHHGRAAHPTDRGGRGRRFHQRAATHAQQH